MSLCINSRRRAFSLPSPILLRLSDFTNIRVKFALSTDAEVTGVSRSRCSMVTRFGNVVLDILSGFFGGGIVDAAPAVKCQFYYASRKQGTSKPLKFLGAK